MYHVFAVTQQRHGIDMEQSMFDGLASCIISAAKPFKFFKSRDFETKPNFSNLLHTKHPGIMFLELQ